MRENGCTKKNLKSGASVSWVRAILRIVFPSRFRGPGKELTVLPRCMLWHWNLFFLLLFSRIWVGKGKWVECHDGGGGGAAVTKPRSLSVPIHDIPPSLHSPNWGLKNYEKQTNVTYTVFCSFLKQPFCFLTIWRFYFFVRFIFALGSTSLFSSGDFVWISSLSLFREDFMGKREEALIRTTIAWEKLRDILTLEFTVCIRDPCSLFPDSRKNKME